MPQQSIKSLIHEIHIEMIQTIYEEDIEDEVGIIITTQEKNLQDVLYVTKLIIYVLNVHLKTKRTSNYVPNVEWAITL